MNSTLTENARSEKALWYQEVLSLDPASRIFLPYARLLAETGRRMEAVEVLRAGLARHPEFLDARLLLIDLLHACGQDAAAGLEASGIIESLSRCSALWDIWSRLPGVRADQSAMLLFFGATFRQGGPSLADVFEAGMQALRARDGAAAVSPVPSEDGAPSPLESSAGDFCGGPTSPEASATHNDAPALPHGEPEPGSAPCSAACAPSASGNDAATKDAAISGDAPSADAPASTEQTLSRAFVMDENAPWYSLDAVPDDDDVYDDEDEPAPAAPVMPPSAMQLFFPDNDAPAGSGDDASVPAVPPASAEGKSSLCTRSMARILEEQGATGEAASIYRELLEVSSSAEERAELNAKLDSLMQGAQSAAPEQPADSGLLTMLETLAARLENKSRA